MAERRRFPAAASGGDLEQRWGAAPSGPGGGEEEEEANPFSFKEFVRSQSGAAAGAPGLRGRASPQECPRLSLLLDEGDPSSESLRLSLEFQEPFFPAPTAVSSLLEGEDDDDDDWSSTYQPSAVEEAALSASASLSSTCDSLDLALPHLQPFSPWRPAENGSLLPGPLRQGDQSLPAEDGPTVEELEEENSMLRSKIVHLEAVSEAQAERVKELERTLAESRRKEARETRDLEAMVQQVEENLQLMTKRALKAESSTMKLKQENTVLQVQVQNFKSENEALRSGHLANLAVVKQNADAALQNLLAVIARSRSSFKQLVSGAEELQLVAELLKSIDKISEMPQDSP